MGTGGGGGRVRCALEPYLFRVEGNLGFEALPFFGVDGALGFGTLRFSWVEGPWALEHYAFAG